MEQAINDTDNKEALNPKYIAYQSLINSGMPHARACSILGYSPNHMYKVRKKKELNRFDLSKLESDSFRLVKSFIKGKPVGEIEKVKDSTALAAAAMVLDRSQPVIKEPINTNNSINFVTINLNGPAKSSDMISIYNDAVPSDTIEKPSIYNDDKIDMIDIDISKDKV